MRVLEKLGVAAELLGEECSFLWPELEYPVAADPVDVLQDGARLLARLVLGVLASDRRALEVERLVDVAVRWEEVVLVQGSRKVSRSLSELSAKAGGAP